MQLSEIDERNWRETLNLEWSATYRYKLQTEILDNPNIVSIINGIMRNESEHIAISANYLLDNFKTDVKGFRTTLFYLYMDLAFEKFANKSYAKFRKESNNEEVKSSFMKLIKSEAGHTKIFRELIEQIENGNFPVVKVCPVCGWELDFGTSPTESTVLKCEKCKVDFKLVEIEGDWQVEKVS